MTPTKYSVQRMRLAAASFALVRAGLTSKLNCRNLSLRLLIRCNLACIIDHRNAKLAAAEWIVGLAYFMHFRSKQSISRALIRPL